MSNVGLCVFVSIAPRETNSVRFNSNNQLPWNFVRFQTTFPTNFSHILRSSDSVQAHPLLCTPRPLVRCAYVITCIYPWSELTNVSSGGCIKI